MSFLGDLAGDALDFMLGDDDDPAPEVDDGPHFSADGGLYLTEKGGEFSGSENLAAVQRAEWEDYLNRFSPFEDILIEKYRDVEGREQAVEKAGLTAGTAMDSSKLQADMDMSRYGLSLSESDKLKRDKKYQLDKSAAVAGAKNTMRDDKESQRMAIMAGGLSSSKQEFTG